MRYGSNGLGFVVILLHKIFRNVNPMVPAMVFYLQLIAVYSMSYVVLLYIVLEFYCRFCYQSYIYSYDNYIILLSFVDSLFIMSLLIYNFLSHNVAETLPDKFYSEGVQTVLVASNASHFSSVSKYANSSKCFLYDYTNSSKWPKPP